MHWCREAWRRWCFSKWQSSSRTDAFQCRSATYDEARVALVRLVASQDWSAMKVMDGSSMGRPRSLLVLSALRPGHWIHLCWSCCALAPRRPCACPSDGGLAGLGEPRLGIFLLLVVMLSRCPLSFVSEPNRLTAKALRTLTS